MPMETSSTSVASPPENAAKARRSRTPIVAAALFIVLLAGLFIWRGTVSSLQDARQAAAAGEVGMATRAFEQYLATHPTDWSVRLEYGSFLKHQNAALALQVLQQIPESATEYIPAVRHIGQIALVGREHSLAEVSLKKLRANDPNDFEVLQALALLYRRQEKDNEALPLLVKCTELNPARIENHLLLAQTYFSLRRPSEMTKPLRQALQLDPKNRDAHLNLAYSYVLQGEYEKARQEGEWSRQNDPGNAQVWRVLSLIERDDANDELALKYARKGLQIDPNEIECRILEGQILAFQKKFQEAYDRMLPVFKQQPREPRVVGVLAESTRVLGRGDEAAKFRKLLRELGNENYLGNKKPGK